MSPLNLRPCEVITIDVDLGKEHVCGEAGRPVKFWGKVLNLCDEHLQQFKTGPEKDHFLDGLESS